jgi:DNA-binding SARP family transcriptional activator/tetratricopeptide (TPR) repeat protein
VPPDGSEERVVEAPNVRFGILGPLRAWRDRAELDLGPRQQRLLLAVLLARAGDWVSVDELIEVLWDGDAPNSATNVIHRHVGLLRRLFEPGLPTRATGRWLLRQGISYQLKVDAGSADLLEFRALVGQAEAARDDPEAVAFYGRALRMWRGPCADGLSPNPQGGVTFIAIDNECAAVAGAMAEVALRCGQAAEALPVLRRMTPRDPLNERLHAQLMLVLAATGHQAEALTVYRAMSERLAGELGIDPGPDLRAAWAKVRSQPEPAAEPPSTPLSRPAQLPLDLSNFGGRRTELARMRDSLVAGETPMTIAVIEGMPGAGKTTLAVRLAHELVGRYPDGQLYVNLRGFDPSGLAVEPSTALLGFLTALGVPGDRMPPDLQAQAALYRTCLAGKRMLVLLDNARDVTQVLPLLPGSSTCLVIVTSRDRLVGLVATEGARPFTLNPVPVGEAREILALRLGARRSREHPDAVDQIVAVCRGLPLALAIVAARAETYPDLPLADIAAELTSGLDALSHDEAHGVRAVFSWSYQSLRPEAARLFRLLTFHWGPDISARACASLLGAPAQIGELSRTRLVTEHVPGRFLVHDLVRAYGMELGLTLDSPDDRRQATHRMLQHYLHSASAANRTLMPHQVAKLDTPPPGVTPETFADIAAASRWLAAEYRVLMMAVQQAIELGHVTIGWQFAITLQTYQHQNGLLQDWAHNTRIALAAAREAGDGLGQIRAERSLAGAYFMLGDGKVALAHLRHTAELIDELGLSDERAFVERGLGEILSEGTPNLPADRPAAIGHFGRAIEMYRDIGHFQGEAYCLEGIALCHMELGDPEQGIALLNQALDLHRQTADRIGEGYAFTRLAAIHLRLERPDEAVELIGQAIDLHTRHRFMQIQDLLLLGDARLARGERVAARTAWDQALDLANEFGAVARATEVQTRLDAMAARPATT